MCYKEKCMCLAVETGALVFAIFNLMLTSLGTVLTLGGVIYTTLFMDEAIDEALKNDDMLSFNKERKQTVLVANLAANMVFAVLAVGFCIAFSFAVVLIVGICKRKANLVKCYFVYGVTKMVCLIAVMILAMISPACIGFGYMSLIFNVVYGLILYMVHMTYKKFESEVAFHSFSNPMAAVQKF